MLCVMKSDYCFRFVNLCVCVLCVVVCVSCGGVVVGGRGTSEKKLLAGRSIRPAMMDRPDQINDWTKALHPSDGTPPPTLSTKK